MESLHSLLNGTTAVFMVKFLISQHLIYIAGIPKSKITRKMFRISEMSQKPRFVRLLGNTGTQY